MARPVGIDLGTTNSVIATMQGREPTAAALAYSLDKFQHETVMLVRVVRPGYGEGERRLRPAVAVVAGPRG
jgi:hypothetical protein